LSGHSLVSSDCPLRLLHPFPTRRSSDLGSHCPIHRLASPAAAARTTIFISVDPPRLEWPSAGEVLEPAERLLDPLLVLDQRESRSEEHTSELQSRFDLVCRLLLEKNKNS